MSLSKAKKTILLYESLVGLLFLSALAIIAYFTIVLSPDNLFKKTWEIRAEFPSVGALKSGDNVKMRGVEIGTVSGISISDDFQKVIISMRTLHEPMIHDDYKIKVSSASVLGGQFIDIDPGSPETPMFNIDKTLIGEPPSDLMTDAADLVSNLKQDELELRKLLTEHKIVEKISTIADNFQQVSEDAKFITDQVKAGKGTLGKLLMDEGIIADAKKSLASFKLAGENISQAGEKVATAADSFKSFGDELNVLITDTKKGQGTLGKLLRDDGIYNELEKTMKNFTTFSEGLNDKNGTLYKVMHDEARLYKDLQAAFTNLKEVTDKVNSGEGTLSKLINEDALYTEAKAVFSDAQEALKQVNLAIQDLREQSPISTFGGVIFGAL